ncbi:MAG: hypothetical protein NVSMB1_22630 [Polyangiales bacterium]
MIASDALGDLEVRPAKFAWDKNGVLRGTFSYRDAIDDKSISQKLFNGLPVNVVMRGYIYPNGGGDPVGLTAHTCKVAYDLWNEVFRVVVNGVTKPPVAVMKGVYRLCTDVDLVVIDRATLKGKADGYFLAVKVEVNPVSEQTLKEIQTWVTRPSGASGSINPGDALFASFVGAFMKKVATADNAVEFRTGSFPLP